MLKLIIVDDERGIIDLIKYLIDYEKIDIRIVGEAQDGYSAYQLIMEKKPDVVITDIRMPGMTGLEMIGKIKETELDASFIVVSGYRDFEYAQNALKFGVSDYLLKPIKKQDLNSILSKLDTIKGKNIILENKITSIQKQLAQSNDVLRKNLLWDYISRIPERMEYASDVLQMEGVFNVDAGYYAVAIIKMDCPNIENNDFSYMAEEAVVVKYVRRLKTECYDVEYIINKTQGYILFHYKADCNSIEQKCNSLKDLIQNDTCKYDFLDFTVGIGTPVNDINKIPMAFATAEQAVLTRIDFGLGKFIFYDKLEDKYKKEYSGLESCDIDKMKKAIINMNLESMLLLINQLFDSGRKDDCTYHLYSLCIEIIALTEQELRINMKDCIIPPISDTIDIINNCVDMNSLKQVCKEYEVGVFNSCMKQKEDMNSKPIRIIKQYIAEHYAKPLSLEDMAGQVYLSPIYISTIFKKETGTTFSTYLLEVRIEKAKELLKTTGLAINEIAEKVGYQDSKHFSKLFIKAVGMKPIAYRKFYS